MIKPAGFLEHVRKDAVKRPVAERIKDYREVERPLSEEDLCRQASRCLDCGIPFCHALGCPLSNRLPEIHDMVYRGHWRRALELLQATNHFPEMTGRICPAPCEAACTLSINNDGVCCRQIERQIAERGWREGWITPAPAPVKTGKRVAVVGSGPAGLAAAQQLVRCGHEVIVFEKDNRIGGILRYGIPNFKLEKWVIDRRLEQMRAEGIVFETNAEVGLAIPARDLAARFDAVCLTIGARVPRDLAIPGRSCAGIHPAMDYLVQQNRLNDGEVIPEEERIQAAGKDVVVIGGGDTGADCVGTARRQGAGHITQIEFLPEPPKERPPENPWPMWPVILRTSTSHEEGCERLWSILTKEFLGQDGRVYGLRCARLEWTVPEEPGPRTYREISGSEFDVKANLVLLAMGFLHVEHRRLVEDLGLEVDGRGNLKADEQLMTSAQGVFAAGDALRGASLVVHAIHQGCRAAEGIDRYLRG